MMVRSEWATLRADLIEVWRAFQGVRFLAVVLVLIALALTVNIVRREIARTAPSSDNLVHYVEPTGR